MVQINGAALRTAQFRRPVFGRRGYDEDEVDAFLDAVEAALRGNPGASGVVELNGRPLGE